MDVRVVLDRVNVAKAVFVQHVLGRVWEYISQTSDK